MPFKSKAQMRFLFAKKPKLAKKFAKEQKRKKGKKSFKRLPEKKRRRNRDDFQLFTPMLEVFDG